ncbi:MAG: response regulator transcription factor [Nonomuraea sp.]|nr:response regulator transcription factor [Nonomuraea sp.]
MIRVLLVDDQLLIRRGLSRLLEIEDGVEVVGEAANGGEALRAVPECRPDVALVDARMPGMGGVELIGCLTRTHPEVACLVLSTFDEDEYVFGALRAGARGYLLKDCSPEDLVAAVERAHRGETVLDGAVAGRVVAGLRADPLSEREREVAELVASGAANREIAAALHITEGTVKNHVSSILRKLGLRDRTQLALHVSRRAT